MRGAYQNKSNNNSDHKFWAKKNIGSNYFDIQLIWPKIKCDIDLW